jgi:hypothetical protein
MRRFLVREVENRIAENACQQDRNTFDKPLHATSLTLGHRI